jgi:hypothetical protein
MQWWHPGAGCSDCGNGGCYHGAPVSQIIQTAFTLKPCDHQPCLLRMTTITPPRTTDQRKSEAFVGPGNR